MKVLEYNWWSDAPVGMFDMPIEPLLPALAAAWGVVHYAEQVYARVCVSVSTPEIDFRLDINELKLAQIEWGGEDDEDKAEWPTSKWHIGLFGMPGHEPSIPELIEGIEMDANVLRQMDVSFVVLETRGGKERWVDNMDDFVKQLMFDAQIGRMLFLPDPNKIVGGE